MAPLGCLSQGIHRNGIKLKKQIKLKFWSRRTVGAFAPDNSRKDRPVLSIKQPWHD